MEGDWDSDINQDSDIDNSNNSDRVFDRDDNSDGASDSGRQWQGEYKDKNSNSDSENYGDRVSRSDNTCSSNSERNVKFWWH